MYTMNSSFRPLLTLIFALTIWQHAKGSSVKIDVVNQYQKDVTPNAFNIRCTWETRGTCSKTIVLMKISKDDETIVGIQRDNTLFYGRMKESSVSAEGHIDKEQNNRTFFSATFTNAVKEDSGLYSCFVQYIDEYGNSKEAISSQNVTINDQDLQDVVRNLLAKVFLLENVIEFQKTNANEKIASLERELKQTMTSKFDQLERAGRTRSQQIKELVDKGYEFTSDINNANLHILRLAIGGSCITFVLLVLLIIIYHTTSNLDQAFCRRYCQFNQKISESVASAFSAVGHENKREVGPGVLKFTTSLLNIGNHYSFRTGLYTAPKKGLYVFQIVLWTTDDDDIYVNLKVNGETLASVFAHDRNSYDQSSVSTVVSLNAKDKVWPSVLYGAKLVTSHESYTGFNGYLLQLL